MKNLIKWKCAGPCAIALAAALTSTVQSERKSRSIGIATNDNFVVMAPAEWADRILERATSYRRILAREFYGNELEDGVEHTCVHFQQSTAVDLGKTSLRPSDDPNASNMIWLHTNPDRALGSTLKHEIAHAVLHARFPIGMPVWANEGLASRYDDEHAIGIRGRIIRGFVNSGEFPSLSDLFVTKTFRRHRQDMYATSESVTAFLIEHKDGGIPKFIDFVENGVNRGWKTALQRHYRINDLPALQKQWQNWVSRRMVIK
jgi:hypothetical protein